VNQGETERTERTERTEQQPLYHTFIPEVYTRQSETTPTEQKRRFWQKSGRQYIGGEEDSFNVGARAGGNPPLGIPTLCSIRATSQESARPARQLARLTAVEAPLRPCSADPGLIAAGTRASAGQARSNHAEGASDCQSDGLKSEVQTGQTLTDRPTAGGLEARQFRNSWRATLRQPGSQPTGPKQRRNNGRTALNLLQQHWQTWSWPTTKSHSPCAYRVLLSCLYAPERPSLTYEYPPILRIGPQKSSLDFFDFGEPKT